MDHNSGTESRDWDELKRIGYEHEDLELKGIMKSFFVLGFFAVLSIFLAAFFFWLINKDAFAPPDIRTAFSRAVPPPPNPLLQTNITSKTDIRELRIGERKVLESYGPVDDQHIRVPIDRAMDLIVEKGIVKGQATVDLAGK